MVGTSGKPVVEKLGIKPGFFIFSVGAPAAYAEIVGQLPRRCNTGARSESAARLLVTEATGLAAKLRDYRKGDRAGRHDLGVVAEDPVP